MLSLTLLGCGAVYGEEAAALDYARDVAPVFQKYCVGCHNPTDREGGLTLDSYAGLLRGGENGKVLEFGQPETSRLLKLITGQDEPAMPPEGSEAPTPAELATLSRWFKAGALGPKDGDNAASILITPKIKPTAEVREPVNALAASPDGRWLAVGRHGEVEIHEQFPGTTSDQKPPRVLPGHTGHVNDLAFSADGSRLIVAAGEAGLFGEVTLWQTAAWKKEATLRGHGDNLFAVALSPDGQTLATGSYDQKIVLWSLETQKPVRELTGHNGPVFDLAFHPQGRILASASGDRTVKLWDVSTGERLETFTEPEKEQYAVAFRPDGRQLAAGGVDNRIRVWRISQSAKAGSNPLLYARFAHEAAILRLAYAPDQRLLVSSSEDRTVKLWETKTYVQLKTLKDQSDWPVALAIAPDNSRLFVGRLDGSLNSLPLETHVAGGNLAAPLSREPWNVPSDKTHWPAVAQTMETEPNDSPKTATALTAPGSARGTLNPAKGKLQDADYYQFSALAGETWILETQAAQTGSPADTVIEVLHPGGQPVQRLLLRAVRDSYITFRPIDSKQNQVRVKNWEEMKLNQYLFMGGEVAKIFRLPEGPDSGFQFYTINGNNRQLYFDTSATVHALDDPVYVVEPYASGTPLIDNGLPVFPVDYANDDDAERELGTDSRLTFIAPKTGEYVVRVTDVRGFSGPQYQYSIAIRPPRPDFRVTLEGQNATIGAGSGQRLKVKLNRIDNFDGPVRVEIHGVPEGYVVSSPIVVEAGHLEAEGVIHADAKAKLLDPAAWKKVRVTATAEIQGETIKRAVADLGHVKLGPKPQVLVFLTPDPEAALTPGPSGELTLIPGETMTAMLSIERNNFKGELKFDVDNLPHGVIVDNIGLSGVLIREGETHRRIELTAAEWVPETTRTIHAVAQGAGKQASGPITFHVREKSQ